MTTVALKYRRIDGVNPEGTLVTSGLVEVTPAYRSDTTQGQLTTITQTFPVGSSITLAGGTYLFRLRASDGHGGRLKDEGVNRLVPASGTFDVDDLTEVTPGVTGVTQSDVAAMIAAAVAGLVVGPGGTPTGTGPGGAFYIQDVQDSTAVGRAVVKAVDAAAGRTAISAAAAASPTITGTATLANVVVTGTTSFVDGSIAQVEVAGLPALATSIAGKASLNPSTGLVNASDIDTAIARQTDVAAAFAAVTTPAWSSIVGVPTGRTYVDLVLPGGVLAPRTSVVVPPGWAVNWVSPTPPPIGGPYMLSVDTYERANV